MLHVFCIPFHETVTAKLPTVGSLKKRVTGIALDAFGPMYSLKLLDPPLLE
jgi:hypothetical protein